MLGVMSFTARADVYRFVDEAGVEYFSDRREDARYHLVLREPVAASISTPHSGCPHCRFGAEIDRVARTEHLDARLLQAVIHVESGFRPDARSPKGAIGLMQLMPETARRFGASDPADPLQNVSAGARYLKTLMAQYAGDLPLALAAYNAGEAAVARHGGRIPPYRETRCYVPAVLRRLASLGAPAIEEPNLLSLEELECGKR